jgi:uncharacterized iron-regulated protein
MPLARPSLWCITLLLSACSARRPAAGEAVTPTTSHESSDAWLTVLDRDHVLVGRVWDVGHGAFIEPSRLLDAVAPRDVLLLGEKHDNPDHHRLQAQLLDAYAARHPATTVAFEMLDVGQQPALDAYLRSDRVTPEGLGPALGWEKTGWPAFTQYLPIAQVALRRKLAIAAANLPTEQVRAVAHEGVLALGQPTIARLRLDQPFPPALETPLLAELQRSHCGHLPESALPRMAAAQHARDAQMASVLAGRGGGAVLIAGAGHARKDRGVPWYMRAAQASATLTSVAFVEVEHGIESPGAYADRFGADQLPFDFVWFTPRATDEDPCAAFHGK